MQFKTAYTDHLFVRRALWGVFLLLALLLFWSGGGFPPRAWLLLTAVLPQVHELWAARGMAMVLPFALLIIQSLAWLIAWGGLLGAAIVHIRRWRQAESDEGWLEAEDDMPALEKEMTVSQKGLQTKQEQQVPQRQSRSLYDYAQPPLVLSANVQAEPQGATPFVRGQGERNAPTHTHTNTHTNTPTPTWQRQLALRMDIGADWDAGITRKDRPNEDSLVALQGTCLYNNGLTPFGLFIVADGMGGHAAGQDASYLAIKAVLGMVLPGIVGCDRMNDEIIIDLLADSVQQANQRVYERSRQVGANMGTTITAALVIDKMAFVVNVGDSRTYLLREGEGLTQVTKDHSYVARLVDAGQITPEDVYTHPDRNQLYRGLGEKSGLEVDWFSVSLEVHDRLLLCSDGLWEMVRDAEIEKILQSMGCNPVQASKALIRAALKGGGVDNISSIVVYMAPITV
jgi:serine/threonine protein phosphatase PrpC